MKLIHFFSHFFCIFFFLSDKFFHVFFAFSYPSNDLSSSMSCFDVVISFNDLILDMSNAMPEASKVFFCLVPQITVCVVICGCLDGCLKKHGMLVWIEIKYLVSFRHWVQHGVCLTQ
jgi:hypothetical protein